MKGTSWMVAAAVVVISAWAGLALRGRSDDAARAKRGEGAARIEREALAGVPVGANARTPLPGEEVAPEPAPLEGDDLVERLRRIAALELEILARVRAGDDPDATSLPGELERTLLPILADPASLQTVLAMLRAGSLCAVGPDGRAVERLSAAEHGAVRALFYALIAYGAPTEELVGLGALADPYIVVRGILAALPYLRDAVRDALVENLLLASEQGGTLLDRSFLAELLFLEAQFPELAESVALLLDATGRALDANEREALYAVLAPDAADPALVALALSELLRGTDPGLALSIGARRFDDPDAPDAIRAAVANAIARDAAEHDAARFLAERANETRRMHDAWLVLGSRPDAAAALDAEYSALAASDADPTAREMLVNGLVGADDERLLAIAVHDAHPRVRGQALLTLTARSDHVPDADLVSTLREHVDSGATHTTKTLLAAGNVARRARELGRPRVQAEAVALLRDVALDASMPDRARRSALAQLRPYLPTEELSDLAATLGGDPRQ